MSSQSCELAHAKGMLLRGTFTPNPKAASLSKAEHFSLPYTPLTIRFSNSTGITNIADTDPNASPRGMAIRFNLPSGPDGKRRHTDIIAHSTPFFPVRTGEDFLAFLQALKAGGDNVGKFLDKHPAAGKFVQALKPLPTSFAREQYWAVSAYVLVNSDGKRTPVRYQLVPADGVELLSEDVAKGSGPNYLGEEIAARLQSSLVGFKLLAQIASEGDVIDDATVHWPDDREIVELGEVKIQKVVEEPEQSNEQKHIIFDPTPRIEGIEESGDPLVSIRSGVYLISGKERRNT